MDFTYISTMTYSTLKNAFFYDFMRYENCEHCEQCRNSRNLHTRVTSQRILYIIQIKLSVRVINAKICTDYAMNCTHAY